MTVGILLVCMAVCLSLYLWCTLSQEITLVWDQPQGEFDSFEVLYQDDQSRLIQNYTYTTSIDIGKYTELYIYYLYRYSQVYRTIHLLPLYI